MKRLPMKSGFVSTVKRQSSGAARQPLAFHRKGDVMSSAVKLVISLSLVALITYGLLTLTPGFPVIDGVVTVVMTIIGCISGYRIGRRWGS